MSGSGPPRSMGSNRSETILKCRAILTSPNEPAEYRLCTKGQTPLLLSGFHFAIYTGAWPAIHSFSLSLFLLPEFWHCPHADFTKITCGVSFSLLPSKNVLNITGIIFLECLKESICECLDTVLSFDSVFRESVSFKFSNELDPVCCVLWGPLLWAVTHASCAGRPAGWLFPGPLCTLCTWPACPGCVTVLLAVRTLPSAVSALWRLQVQV